MPTSKTRPTLTDKQDIEQLKTRYHGLRDKQVAAKANMETSEKSLAELKRKAREQYGTDDIGELKKKLEAMKTENERLRADYQQHLDAIEESLERVEAAHKAAINEDAEV